MDINRLGKDLFLVGAIFGNDEEEFSVYLPETPKGLSLEQWKEMFHVIDRMPMEALVKDDEGKIGKAIIYKSSRQISGHVSWRVFRRDNFTCRYCGANDVPMTVDHLVLWEDGGPSIEENLVTACSKCNKKRGNMQYGDWLRSKKYESNAKYLPIETYNANIAVGKTLSEIPRVPIEQGKKRSRR